MLSEQVVRVAVFFVIDEAKSKDEFVAQIANLQTTKAKGDRGVWSYNIAEYMYRVTVYKILLLHDRTRYYTSTRTYRLQRSHSQRCT